MKTLESKINILLTGAFIIASSLQTVGQTILPEFTVTAASYKYLNAVNPEEAAQTVAILEKYAAAYDVTEAEFYEEEHDKYFVSFVIPEGKILAAYDANGNIIRTAEKFRDIALPTHIRQAVNNRFPQWEISSTIYLVNYYYNKDVTKKIYKLLLKNGDKLMRIKMSDEKEFF